MTIHETYAKWKHMDKPISNMTAYRQSEEMLKDLWQAVKAAAEEVRSERPIYERYHLIAEAERLDALVTELREQLDRQAVKAEATKEPIDFHSEFLAWRGIDPQEVCPACSGAGSRAYGSTSAWRGGIGGQTITRGICDYCWGSGNAVHPWTNLRRLEAPMTAAELRAFLNLLMNSDPWYGGQATLAQLADRESRKRGYTDWVEAYHKMEAPCQA